MTITDADVEDAPWLKDQVEQVDQQLADLYGTKLLQRYWSGRTTPAEKAYQQQHAAWAQAARASGQRAAASRPVAGPKPQVQTTHGAAKASEVTRAAAA